MPSARPAASRASARRVPRAHVSVTASDRPRQTDGVWRAGGDGTGVPGSRSKVRHPDAYGRARAPRPVPRACPAAPEARWSPSAGPPAGARTHRPPRRDAAPCPRVPLPSTMNRNEVLLVARTPAAGAEEGAAQADHEPCQARLGPGAPAGGTFVWPAASAAARRRGSPERSTLSRRDDLEGGARCPPSWTELRESGAIPRQRGSRGGSEDGLAPERAPAKHLRGASAARETSSRGATRSRSRRRSRAFPPTCRTDAVIGPQDRGDGGGRTTRRAARASPLESRGPKRWTLRRRPR